MSPDVLGPIKKRLRQLLPALGIAALLGECGSVWAEDTQAVSAPRESSLGDPGLAEIRGKGPGEAVSQLSRELEIPWRTAIILWDEGQGSNRKDRTPAAGAEGRQSNPTRGEGKNPAGSDSRKGTNR